MGQRHKTTGARRAMPAQTPPGAPSALGQPFAGRVRIATKDRQHELYLRLGKQAVIVPQVPRIEQQDIPWRAPQSQWLGQTLGTLVIDGWMDAWPDGSIESDWRILEAMARPVQAGRSTGAPSPLQLAGTVPGQDRWWQITGITPGEDEDDVEWTEGGFRCRQRVTLELGQWNPIGQARIGARQNQRTSTGAKRKRAPVTVKKGDTLVTIALDALGDSKRWKEIAALNPHGSGKTKKARRTPEDVKTGERLRLPQD